MHDDRSLGYVESDIPGGWSLDGWRRRGRVEQRARHRWSMRLLLRRSTPRERASSGMTAATVIASRRNRQPATAEPVIADVPCMPFGGAAAAGQPEAPRRPRIAGIQSGTGRHS